MELILLSHPEFFSEESRIVFRLMENYSFTFHLRKSKASSKECADFLKEIPECFHRRIVLHDAYELDGEFGLKGLHFSTAKRSLANSILTEGSKSTSCHSVAEARELDGSFDYLFISPVFKSISKQNYEGNLDMLELKSYLQEERKTKVTALGGISENTIPQLTAYPFDGLAVLGAVWTRKPEVNIDFMESNFLKINQCIQRDLTV